MEKVQNKPRWEHFPHDADIGVRGIGSIRSQAFEQAALALTAVVTDPKNISEKEEAHFSCEAPDDELLLVDWLNTLIYKMDRDQMVFGRFEVFLLDQQLEATAWGEHLDPLKHEAAVEVKGATYTELRVQHIASDEWVAQCVVDV